MIKKGRGMSAVIHPTGFKGGGDPDQATLRLKVDGTVDLMVGAVDYGEGSKTVLRQFAAEALDVPPDNITVQNISTDTMPFSTDTAASRLTFIAGNAVLRAADDFKRKSGIWPQGSSAFRRMNYLSAGGRFIKPTTPAFSRISAHWARRPAGEEATS